MGNSTKLIRISCEDTYTILLRILELNFIIQINSLIRINNITFNLHSLHVRLRVFLSNSKNNSNTYIKEHFPTYILASESIVSLITKSISNLHTEDSYLKCEIFL